MSTLKKVISLALVCTMLISTVACLGGAFTFGASAADVVHKNYAGKEFPIGEVGTTKTNAEMKAAYDSEYGLGTPDPAATAKNAIGTGGWTYLASDSYEVPAEDYQEYDILANATPTDGYVQPGDYIFTTMTYDCSDNLWLALSLLAPSFSADFFDFIATPSGSITASGDAKGTLNTDIKNYGYRMNQDNGMCVNATYRFKVVTQTSTQNATTTKANQTGLTTAQLATIACFQCSGDCDASKSPYVLKGDSTTWLFGFLLQVKADLANGTTGGIFIVPEFIKNGTSTLTKGRFMTDKVAYLDDCAITSGKMNWNLEPNGYTAIYDDFGCYFVIGEPTPDVTYTVKFMNGDAEVASFDDLAEGATIAAKDSTEEVKAPADPTPAESTNFVGWSLTEGGAVVSFPYAIVAPEDEEATEIILYAVFSEIPHHDVLFVNPKDNKVISTVNVAEEESYTIDAEAPNVKGYTFQGWTTTANDASTLITGSATMGTADVTYYAYYTVNKYTVSFDANGGTFAEDAETSFEADYDSAITAISAEPEKAGYTFKGWAASKSGNELDDLGNVPNSDITFFAVYEANKYKLNLFASADAETAYTSVDVTYGQAVSVKAAEVDAQRPGFGYKFDKWVNKATSAESTEKTSPIGKGVKYETLGDTDVYACWTDNTVVKFYVSDGNGFVEAAAYEDGNTIDWAATLETAKSVASENGVTYSATKLNWYSDEALSAIAYSSDGKDTNKNAFAWSSLTENLNLYLGKADAAATLTIGEGDTAYTVTSAANAKEGDTNFRVEKSKADAAAPFGSEFTGIYDAADEDKTPIEPAAISSGNYYYALQPGNHTYAPIFEELDLSITIVLRIDSKVAGTANAELGDTASIDTLEFVPADESKPVPAIGDELVNFNKAGYILDNWKSPAGSYNLVDGFAIDEALLKSSAALSTDKGVYTIYVDSVTSAKLYTATIVVDNGGKFEKTGTTTETIEVAVGTSLSAIQSAVEEQFGKAVKEGYHPSNWSFDKSVDKFGNMPAMDFTYTIPMVSNSFRATYITGTDEEGNPVVGWSKDIYYGDDSAPLYEEEFKTYRWQPYNLFLGWKLTGGEVADDGTIIGDVTITADYDPFNNYLLIVYNSNITGADVPLNTGSAANQDIYMTLSKKLKLSYWKEGQRVSRKDTKCNLKEGSFTLFYLLKFVGRKDGGFYINACPFTLPWSIFDPREIGDTFKLIGTALKALL